MKPGATKAVSAHIDFFPTLAAITGAELPAAARHQVEGRSLVPLMVNEKAVGSRLNPFAVRYWKQFGGGPTAADYDTMDPTKPWPPPAGGKGRGDTKAGEQLNK